MNKQIWYGVGSNGNQVQFAENQTTLTDLGVTNPQSFTVNGEVQGLNLIGATSQNAGAQSSSSQTA